MDKDLLIFLGTIPWIIFLIVVIVSLNKNPLNNKQLNNLLLFVLLFATIRYGIGYDYFSYKEVIEGLGYDYQLERWEILPRMLAIFSRKVHSQFFFAISSLLSIYPVYFVSKKLSIAPIVSFSLYLLFPILFLDGLGIIRNSVAFSMVLMMFYSLHKKAYIHSLLYWLIAIGFHTSAIIAIVIYFLYYFCHSKSINILFYLLSFIASFAFLPFLFVKFSDFWVITKLLKNAEAEFQGGGLIYYVFNSLAIFNLLNWNKIASYSNVNKIYLSISNFGVCTWNSFLPIDLTTAQRVSTYFLFFLVLLIPSYKYVFKRRIVYKSVITFFVLLFMSSISLNLFAYYSQGLNMSNIPYQVFFLNPSDLLYHSN